MSTLSIFIYPGSTYTHISRTIESILDNTKQDELKSITVISEESLCEDILSSYKYLCSVVSSDIVASLNERISSCGSDYAAIIFGDVKVLSGDDWWKSQEDVYSIPEYELDTFLWQSKGSLRTNAEFINMSLLKDFNDSSSGSTCSDSVMVVQVERFKQLGGFDSRYAGNLFTEFCLRHCVESGSLEHKYNNGRIASRTLKQDNVIKANSIIAYNYFRKHYETYKTITGCDYPKDSKYKQVDYDTDQFAKHNFDLKLYGLYASARGKRVAVIGPGASLDNVCIDWLHDFDILIGVDYVPTLVECDYCITERSDVASYIYNNSDYSQNQMVLPYRLEDRVSGTYTSSDLFSGSIRYSKSNSHISIFPPFIDGFVESVATHLAIFLRPDSITLFGVDSKIVGDVSHTKKIVFYNDGKVWIDSEGTSNLLRQREAELKILKGVSDSLGINLMRVSYA